MKTKTYLLPCSVLLIFLEISSCRKPASELTPKPVTPDFTEPVSLGPVGNLGRVLFYDTRLSVNNSISCASCHKQALAFSDNAAFSRGFENKLTLRNTIAVQNIFSGGFGQNSSLFWDGREEFLENMVLQPIVNHVEMGMNNISDLVERVRNTPYYDELFKKAYGQSTTINAARIADALAWFITDISSFQTRYQQWKYGLNDLTAIEKQGDMLFFGKYNCGSCHQLQGLAYEKKFMNIGLDLNYSDAGRQHVTHDPADAGKFKVPDLRNVAITAPYMHDGRFKTLDEVLEHYSHNIAAHPNLDSLLKSSTNQPLRMNISDQEKEALIAFLKTLTDYTMISNPDLSNPFTH